MPALSTHIPAVLLQSALLTVSRAWNRRHHPAWGQCWGSVPAQGTRLSRVPPSSAHPGAGGQSSGISGALTTISEKHQRQTLTKAPAFYISLPIYLFILIFWQSAGSSAEPSAAARQPQDSARVCCDVLMWMPTSPCASLQLISPTCQRALGIFL